MTWKSRTWSGARSSRRSRTLVPAAISFRSPRRNSASARKSLAALAVHFTSPLSTIPATLLTPLEKGLHPTSCSQSQSPKNSPSG